MAKANIDLSTGTKVTIEGTTEEVERLVQAISASQAPKRSKPGVAPTVSKLAKARRLGPTERVRALIQDGFFGEKRALLDVGKKLEELGHFHSYKDLSVVLLRLTRAGELRRIREGDSWVYVNP